MILGEEKGGRKTESKSTADKQLSTILNPRKKPHKIMIIYSKLDPHDNCPLIDFHIAVKPLE
jgi:hypothetical protein